MHQGIEYIIIKNPLYKKSTTMIVIIIIIIIISVLNWPRCR